MATEIMFLALTALAWAGAPPAVSARSVPAVSSRTIGPALLEGIPEIPAQVAERMLQYQNTRSVGLLEFSPDGKGLLISTRFGETAQLHWLDRPMGARRQLTFHKEPIREARIRPRGGPREIAFSMDSGGTENMQIYLRRADGRAELLTDGKSRHESLLWSRVGDRLAFVGTARNGKDFDLYAVKPGEGKPELLAALEGQWTPLAWSPFDLKLLLQQYISINESHLFVFDLNNKSLTPLFPAKAGKKIAFGTARWGRGGKTVYFTSDETGEFVSLGRLHLPSGEVEWLTRDIPWDVELLEVSRDGAKVAFTVNEDGRSALYLLEEKGRLRRAAGIPLGVIGEISFPDDAARLAFTLSGPSSPGDAFTLDWKSGKIERWTESETGGLPRESFVEPELIRFPTHDKDGDGARRLAAYYYAPKTGGPHPFVVLIHGGPEAQYQPYFSPTVQYWVNELGIAVLAPNVRGSSGYGKSFLQLDNGFKREDSVKDIGALLDWAAARPELDARRAAVYGGSYGGYMVLASLARYAERLRAGVDVVGISNFVTFLENTKDYRRDLRRVEYGDEREPAMKKFLADISPTALVGKMLSALFVVQGANDPRVPASEAEQIVKAVRANGRPVWYLLAKDEGHGFAKKSNRDLMEQAVTLFWQENLLPKR